jgi:glucose/arabinose dehydrogenase
MNLSYKFIKRYAIYLRGSPKEHDVQASNQEGFMRLLQGSLCCVAGFALLSSTAFAQSKSNFAKQSNPACPNDDTALKLPPGFCATVFADGIGHARHVVVSPSGLVYVNTWSGRYYGNDVPHAGGFLVVLQDKNGIGKADVIERFGETVQSGGAGGTGIGLYRGWLYAEINDRIVRYALPAGSAAPRGAPETILSGLPLGGDHPMHPFIIDAKGSMYIDRCTLMLPPPPTPARREIANCNRPA